MTQLAIKGHSTRGSEVISLLEMLGGINSHNLYGDENYAYYTIDSDNEIKGGIYVFGDEKLYYFTLEEFLEKFPYKVGDKVWLHYKNLTTRISETITCMRWCNKYNCILYDVSTCCNLRESVLTPYKKETMEEKDKAKAPNLIGEDYSGKRFGYQIPNGYEFDCIKNNEIILKPKQPQYPKTYEECCEVLFPSSIELGKVLTSGYNCEKLKKFGELLICRDAYWKIAGEQMGLGKPWEPNWTTLEGMPAIFRFRYNIVCDYIKDYHCLLVFPTAEMRDAFYENFKELIESCKELL